MATSISIASNLPSSWVSRCFRSSYVRRPVERVRAIGVFQTREVEPGKRIDETVLRASLAAERGTTDWKVMGSNELFTK